MPVRIHGEIIICEHETIKGIFGHNIEEDRAPTTIEGGRLLEDEGDHQLDVVHCDGSVELCLLRVLILGKPSIGFLHTSSACPGLGSGCFGSSDRLFVFGPLLEVLDGRRHGDRDDERGRDKAHRGREVAMSWRRGRA
jgi:hypothetical protein